MFSAPQIILDNCYTEQINLDNGVESIMPDLKFLINSNNLDRESIKWFSNLSTNLDLIKQANTVEEILQIIIKIFTNKLTYLSIRSKQDARIIGFFSFESCATHINDLQIYLCEKFRGSGIMSKILYELVAYLKSINGNMVSCILAFVDTTNTCSIKFCEKNSFEKISNGDNWIQYKKIIRLEN